MFFLVVKRNRLGGVLYDVFASSAVDRGFGPGRVKSKTINLEFAVSPLSMSQGVRANTGLLGIKIACPIGATCLPTSSELKCNAIKIQPSALVKYKADIIISLNVHGTRYGVVEKVLIWR